MNEIFEAAVKYAKRGWSVFPVRKNKTPYTPNGFHNATTDIRTIERWWKEHPDANVGIATGSMSHGLTVIDIDIDDNKGIHGDESFRDWCDDEGVFIDSLTAVTGRGGKHLYFTSTYPYGNKTGVLPGVDIRGEGGYVIAPPSIHENGRHYYFDGDEDEEEIVCLQEDSDAEYFFNEMCKSPMGDKEPLVVPEEMKEGGRNDLLFKMAASFQAKGVEDAVILASLQGYNEKHCNPPLPDEELEKIVQNVVTRYHKGSTKEEDINNSDSSDLDDFPLIRANDIKNKKLDPLVYYVGEQGDEFLVQGLCVLSSKPKLGKSWFCNSLSKCITEGSDFLGYKTKRCHVIYIDLEQCEQLQQRRFNKMSEENLDNGFYCISYKNLDIDRFIKKIDDWVRDDPDIGVVIIDVFQKIRRPKKSNENEYDVTYRELTQLKEVADKHKLAIVLVCHDRKTVDDSDPFSNILGSTALQGAPDQMIVLYKDKFDDDYTHIAAKGRTLENLVRMDAKIEDGIWVKSERTAIENHYREKMKDEYLNSEFRPLMLNLMKAKTEWKGRCNQFVKECKDLGIIDSTEDISLKALGSFFSKYILFADEIDHIKMSNVKNGNAGKIYTLTIDTIDEWDYTIDDVPFKNG